MSWLTEQVSPAFEVRFKIKKKLFDKNSRVRLFSVCLLPLSEGAQDCRKDEGGIKNDQ